ncbi:MAG: hypothetical protein KGI11_08490 [Thaumarchaeota archaeon]|nr:hypothetical protein [Nitrososphaerota archaeon]
MKSYALLPLLLIFGVASAQQYSDVTLEVNDRPIALSIGNPALTTIPSGNEVYATIHLDQPMQIACSLTNCVKSVETDTTYGGWLAIVRGSMPNDTAEIQTINGQGIPTYTILMQPNDVDTQLKREFHQNVSDCSGWMEIFCGAMIGLGVIPIIIVVGGFGFGIYATIRHLRNIARRNRRWRLN